MPPPDLNVLFWGEMPELPEVETVARGLRAVLPGRRITGVRLSAKTDFIDDPAALERELPGTRVTGIKRYGKFLVIELERTKQAEESGQIALLIHLGMTGQIVVGAPEAPVLPHTHVFLALDDGRELRYTDIRRFGRMGILLDGEHEALIGRLGLEPLEASEREFRQTITSRSAHHEQAMKDVGRVCLSSPLHTDHRSRSAASRPRRSVPSRIRAPSAWDRAARANLVRLAAAGRLQTRQPLSLQYVR